MHKAQRTAIETANLNGVDPATVRRVLDSGFPKGYPCWRVRDDVVIYEDDPGTVVSIIAAPGRLVDP